MPQKINMFISNGNATFQQRQAAAASLAAAPQKSVPSALNAPIIARIHNVRPGCGSCGRH